MPGIAPGLAVSRAPLLARPPVQRPPAATAPLRATHPPSDTKLPDVCSLHVIHVTGKRAINQYLIIINLRVCSKLNLRNIESLSRHLISVDTFHIRYDYISQLSYVVSSTPQIQTTTLTSSPHT